MVEHRHTLVLYTTATCNLNCRYCYIDKNPALVKIDDLLDISFQDPNYYFDFAKKVFPNPGQLRRIEYWGGEPSRRLDRAYALTEKLIEHYYNLSEFSMSTNLTLDSFQEQLGGLLDVLAKFPNRRFTFFLQLSLDGPTHINDTNRGVGVTKRFTENFLSLMKNMDEILENRPNIFIQAFFKPTLDGSSIRQLQTKKSIIEYYKFFENYQEAVNKLVFNHRFMFSLSIPNTATPSPHTKEEGQLFGNLIRLCREIEEENSQEQIFRFYKYITPFGENRWPGCKDLCNKGVCGTGRHVIGLLPNDMISTCHNGFTQLLADYKKYCLTNIDAVDRTIDFNLFVAGEVKNDMVFPYEGLAEYETQIEDFYNQQQTFLLQNYVGLIQLLAKTNQIDQKYLDPLAAIQGANLVYGRTSICIRDHLGSTGTKYLPPIGFFKLLLNGADKYLMREGEVC